MTPIDLNFNPMIQISTDNYRYKFNPVLVKDKNRKKIEKSNKQLKKFFKFVDGNGKVRYPDFDPKYTKLKESKPKDLATLNNEEALDLTYTYRPKNKKDPILKCKKCLKEWFKNPKIGFQTVSSQF